MVSFYFLVTVITVGLYLVGEAVIVVILVIDIDIVFKVVVVVFIVVIVGSIIVV